MRSVVLSVSLCVLAGCATVSVVPGEATVEAALTKSQSELRTASNACSRDGRATSADLGVSSLTRTGLAGVTLMNSISGRGGRVARFTFYNPSGLYIRPLYGTDRPSRKKTR